MPVTINGDGLIEVGGTTTTQGRVRLAEDTDNGSNYVELTAPASVTANRTVTFPDANINFSTGLGVAQGGTGLTTLTAGNNALYSTSASALTAGTLPVAAGGTGAATLTANNVILGNGTSAVQVVAPSTSGNVLTSNGTTWTSAAAPSIVPSSITAVGSIVLAAVNTTSNLVPGSTVSGSNVYIPNAISSWPSFGAQVYSASDTEWNNAGTGGNMTQTLRITTGNTGYLTPAGTTVGSGTWRTLWYVSARASSYDSCVNSTYSYTGVTLLVRIS